MNFLRILWCDFLSELLLECRGPCGHLFTFLHDNDDTAQEETFGYSLEVTFSENFSKKSF